MSFEGPTDNLLGQMLLARDLVQPAELERALASQARVGGRLGGLLMRVGALSEDSLLDVLSAQLDWPVMGRDTPLPEAADLVLAAEQQKLPVDWLLDQQVIVWTVGETLHFAARDPLAPALVETIERSATLPPQPTLCRSQDLDRLLDQVALVQRDALRGNSDDARHLREMAEEAPVVELVSNLMAQAVEQGASDIHVEPEESQFTVRFRIDGVLHSRLALPRSRFDAVASRLKLLSGMDIAERRLPQDGRMSTRVSGRDMDIRMSALPGVHGESVVMRLLPKERRELSLDRLGFAPDHLALMRAWSEEANGIYLVTGPTGSGKSTTLYGALAAANDGHKKMITVEDPVEFQLPGITQIQTHADIGLNFSGVLRSILRQDPDVIMIGEIRDLETAEIAIQAALTGHLVLSTLHTNDAISAFTRLVDMGVEPYLVAAPVKGVQAQRLVRRLCEACAVAGTAPAELWSPALEDAAVRFYPSTEPHWRQAVGCAQCQGSGFRGRIGIYELVPVSEDLRHQIMTGASASALRATAAREGHRTLREDGLLKAWLGVTSVDEVMRVTGT